VRRLKTIKWRLAAGKPDDKLSRRATRVVDLNRLSLDLLWGGRKWCFREASRSILGLVWPWPLTSCIRTVVTQLAYTAMCVLQVWLKFAGEFLRYNRQTLFLWPISASYDLDFWPPDPFLSWPVEWTTYARFTRF